MVVDYPDDMIQPLVTYLIRTKRWEWDPTKMLRKVDRLKTEMHRYRVKLATDAAARAQFESELAEYIDQQIPSVLGALVSQEANE